MAAPTPAMVARPCSRARLSAPRKSPVASRSVMASVRPAARSRSMTSPPSTTSRRATMGMARPASPGGPSASASISTRGSISTSSRAWISPRSSGQSSRLPNTSAASSRRPSPPIVTSRSTKRGVGSSCGVDRAGEGDPRAEGAAKPGLEQRALRPPIDQERRRQRAETGDDDGDGETEQLRLHGCSGAMDSPARSPPGRLRRRWSAQPRSAQEQVSRRNCRHKEYHADVS